MRAGRINKGWVLSEGGEFIGVSLGADFCAEHEWGIDGLNQTLGIEKREPGIPSTIARDPDMAKLRYVEDDHLCLLVCCFNAKKIESLDGNLFEAAFQDEWPFSTLEFGPEFALTPKRRKRKKQLASEWDISSAWYSGGFMLLARKEHAERVKALYDAADKENLVVFVSGKSNPFDRGGLVLALADKIPTESVENMRSVDQSQRDMNRDFAESRIAERLSAAGKKADLQPQPIGEEEMKKLGTSHTFRVFLVDRKGEAKTGWYTVEEVDRWLTKNDGPVVKTD